MWVGALLSSMSFHNAADVIQQDYHHSEHPLPFLLYVLVVDERLLQLAGSRKRSWCSTAHHNVFLQLSVPLLFVIILRSR